MNDITFRPALAADALCIGVLGTQVFLDTYATGGIRPSLARETLAQMSTATVSALLTSPRYRFIVVERDDHMIAFAQLTVDSTQKLLPTRPAAELNRLYVQEPFTGTGVGSALLAQAEALARAEGARALWLNAWIGNHRALAFYERRAYRDIGASIYAFENEEHENRVFAKSLVDAPPTSP